MADYDIEEAFEAIEKELIDSMMRNLERHKAEEDEEGFNWTMWQAEQLKSLQEYKKRNKDKFGKEFEYINKRIEMFIKGSRRKGQLDQERKILKALKEGKARAKGEPGDVSGNFFRINDRKINALIKATNNDFEKAETAMLRRADDQYRKIIYNAQVYANTGAGTYEKAVDMATKDFLSRGIDCIEYKNGSRHNIRDYARMCLRTAGKRAYLTGEGESRQERGLHLVIINKRGNPCPLCAKWLGKVLIDDVWSGGSKKDGDYPLMSQAVAAGLYHPQCQDVHDTYFDDGFDDWYDSASKEERKEMLDRYNNGQKMNYAKRQAEKYGRLEEYSLDEDNKKKYKARKEEWKEKEEKYEEKYEQKSIEIIEDVPKEDVKPRKVYKAKELDNMSLAKLRKISEELATEYYESGISGISFGKTEPAMAAKMLAAMGSKTSLKKDILSIQKSLKGLDESKGEKFSKGTGKIKADKALKDLDISVEETLENVGKRGKIADIAFKSKLPSAKVQNDKTTVIESFSNLPKKVRNEMLKVKFDLGNGGCACDYKEGIVYVGKGAEKQEIDHEIGHLIEHRMMDKKTVAEYKKYLVEGLSAKDIYKETFCNTTGEEVDVFIVKGERFVSEYQGRIYASSIEEALNDDGSINTDLMLETISEPFRMYQNDKSTLLKDKKIIELIEGAIQ